MPIADRGDRVAVALEHAHAPAAQREDRGREQDQPDHHPLRLLAGQHGVDSVDHHDSHAREHRDEREQVGIGVRQRETDHEVRRQAQPEEQRAVGERHAGGVVEREVGRRPRRVALGLDEDRREAGGDEQRGGHEPSSSRFRGLSTPASVPRLTACGSGPAARLVAERARRRRDLARPVPDMSGPPVTSHDDERPPSLWLGHAQALPDRQRADRRAQRWRDSNGRAEQAHRGRRRGLPDDQRDQSAQGRSSRPTTAAARRRSWSSARTGARGSKDAYDRYDPPHSDTLLLVRFDPEQEQTSVLSIPRDLMVNITTRADGSTASKRSTPPTRSATSSAAPREGWCSRRKRSSARCSPACS